VARLALRCDVPIIPVGLVGTRAVQPPGSMIMRPFHSVTIRFGPPVAFPSSGAGVATGRSGESPRDGPAAQGGEPDQVELREMTDALMSEISRLSGQEYVDLYAKRATAG
jgi:1-acyl-sn-glycerol-3-phosphate acyltransferase